MVGLVDEWVGVWVGWLVAGPGWMNG